MSPKLRAFLTAYLNWWGRGAPDAGAFDDVSAFSRGIGLCDNLRRYMFYGEKNSSNSVARELSEMFVADGLNPYYPFNAISNTRGATESAGFLYSQEALERKCHLNERRINWVKEKLANV